MEKWRPNKLGMANKFKPIPGHPGYHVTWYGTIRRDGSSYVRHRQSQSGPQVMLNENGIRTLHSVAYLVLETFVGPCPVGSAPEHIDGDTDDCCIENLRWSKRKHLT